MLYVISYFVYKTYHFQYYICYCVPTTEPPSFGELYPTRDFRTLSSLVYIPILEEPLLTTSFPFVNSRFHESPSLDLHDFFIFHMVMSLLLTLARLPSLEHTDTSGTIP